MPDSKKISLRIDPELEEILDSLTDKKNVSSIVKDALHKHLLDQPILSKEDRLRIERKSTPKKDNFRLPVGDVICFSTNPTSRLWWCAVEKVDYVRELASVWVENGFKFCVGVEGGGNWHLPEVIEEERQERKVNGWFCRSCKGVSAYVGDRMVWLEIVDAAKAISFMYKYTQIPCALRCDVYKYTYDLGYATAFDRANNLFIHYHLNGSPLRLDDTLSELDLVSMLDL